MNHYQAYLKEYQGHEYVESEHGAFAYTVYPEDKVIHLAFIFVPEEKRKGIAFARLFDEFEKIGRKHGCLNATTFVYKGYKKKEWSLLSAIRLGFSILDWDLDRITLVKGL